MEKHKCKLCSKTFANGRALGGHMRSHLMIQPSREAESLAESLSLLSSSPSSSSSDSEEDIEENEYEEEENGELMSYRFKGNPRKKIKLADLEDRVSETESTRNLTRSRSKRLRRRPPSPSFDNETELTNSISDVTSEEDLAFCLMMLSRDKPCHGKYFGDYVTNSYHITSTKKIKEVNNFGSNMSKYKCETCNKIFKSYQALGGHRASHKKARVAANTEPDNNNDNNDNNNNDNNSNNNNQFEVKKKQLRKIHECPICFRVFLSGQALGGHKRIHVNGENNDNQITQDDDDVVRSKKINNKVNTMVIDLNLPAPNDDNDI